MLLLIFAFFTNLAGWLFLFSGAENSDITCFCCSIILAFMADLQTNIKDLKENNKP